MTEVMRSSVFTIETERERSTFLRYFPVHFVLSVQFNSIMHSQEQRRFFSWLSPFSLALKRVSAYLCVYLIQRFIVQKCDQNDGTKEAEINR